LIVEVVPDGMKMTKFFGCDPPSHRGICMDMKGKGLLEGPL